MNQHKFSFRLGVLMLLVVLIMGLFAVRLQNIQIVQAQAQQEDTPQGSFVYDTTINAARGEILDRNGNVLVGNRASFNLVLVKDVFLSTGTVNESLQRLTNLCAELGLDYTDHLPVTKEKPYEYDYDSYTSTYNSYFRDFLNTRGWDSDISAPQLIRRLRDRYNIPEDWTEAEARRVISIRYELELRNCTNLPTYVLLSDVDTTSLAALTELNISGLNVVKSTVREYYTTYAAHILGRTAQMSPQQWEYYKELGYSMDAYVGKEGLEEVFESELHATNGTLRTTVASDGTLLSEYYTVEPKAGNNVELTIDINIQKIAEDGLAATILDLRENGLNEDGDGKDAEGGAIVVQLVDTGEVLACASYPTYNLATYSQDYNDILADEYAPLYNRALSAPYPPGSIYKMVTTIAGIDSEAITAATTIEDKGEYRRFEDSDYTPRCMLYTNTGLTHGVIDVMQALAVSCNYYFYELAWMIGLNEFDAVGQALGLGEPTGIELAENTGRRANPEVKAELYEGDDARWYGADTVTAAIGQSEHRYTVMQLCSYTSALANQGTRYEATFLRRVLSSDYQHLITENEPTIASQLEISDAAYDAYSTGMQMACTSPSGTCYSVFGGYDVAVCAKTGTAEHGSGGSDNASFVLYAPADDPEIAIAIYVEKGAQGGNLGNIAKSILDYYFSVNESVDSIPGENQLN